MNTRGPFILGAGAVCWAMAGPATARAVAAPRTVRRLNPSPVDVRRLRMISSLAHWIGGLGAQSRPKAVPTSAGVEEFDLARLPAVGAAHETRLEILQGRHPAG